MKLLIIGPRWVGEWTEGMGRAAEALGHTVALFFYWSEDVRGLKDMAYRSLPPVLHKILKFSEQRFKSARDILMNRRLIITAREFQPDVIIVLKGEIISKATLEALRQPKIPIITWWVDDPFRFPDILHHFELFDMVYLFDKECATNLALQLQGVKRVLYLPCACDQTIFYPQSINPSDYPLLNCTIGFVAVYYPERAALLRQMKDLHVGLWGSGWEVAQELCELPEGTWRGLRITAVDAAKVYNLAKICPNIHHSQTRLGGLNTRTFEILAAGGFELVDNVPGLEEHFDVGREIAAYSSPAHFLELTDYYLTHPVERSGIIARGYDRVIHDHTYTQRLDTILANL